MHILMQRTFYKIYTSYIWKNIYLGRVKIGNFYLIQYMATTVSEQSDA
jgi:hypothetical protein